MRKFVNARTQTHTHLRTQWGRAPLKINMATILGSPAARAARDFQLASSVNFCWCALIFLESPPPPPLSTTRGCLCIGGGGVENDISAHMFILSTVFISEWLPITKNSFPLTKINWIDAAKKINKSRARHLLMSIVIQSTLDRKFI